MKKSYYIILASVSLLTFSCKPLENLINKQLPKLSTVDQQVNAINEASENIDFLNPSAGVFISSKLIKEFLPKEINAAALDSSDAKYQIKSFESSVSLDKQSVLLDATFSMYITSLDANIEGTMNGLGGFSSLRDTVYIYGAFSSVQVNEVTFSSKHPKLGRKAKAQLIKPVLKRYLENLNRLMFKSPVKIYSGIGSNLSLNVKEMFKDPQTNVLSSPTNTILRVSKEASFLIDEFGIRVILELTSSSVTSPIDTSGNTGIQSYTKRDLKQKFDTYFRKYNKKWLAKFDTIPDSNNLAVYISKSEISSLFNEAMAGEIHLSHKLTIPESNSSSDLRLDEKKINCNELLKPFSYPKFKGDKCDWSCTKTIKIPFGSIKVDDPVCLANRALCVSKREIERAAWNTGREAARILRQAENEANVAACNLAREANNFMNLGKAKTRYSGDGIVNLRLSNISFNTDLERLTLKYSGDVGLDFKSKISLYPQDLGYVFLCISDYNKQLNGNAIANFTEQIISVDFNAIHRQDQLILTATPGSMDYKARISPIPSLELLSDLEFNAKCSFLSTAIGIASATSFTDLVKYDTETELFLQGWSKGSYTIPSFSKTINPILFKINEGENRKATPFWSKNCISFSY